MPSDLDPIGGYLDANPPPNEDFEAMYKRRGKAYPASSITASFDNDVPMPPPLMDTSSGIEDRRSQRSILGPGEFGHAGHWLTSEDLVRAGEKLHPPPHMTVPVIEIGEALSPMSKALGAEDLNRQLKAQEGQVRTPYIMKPEMPNNTPLNPGEVAEYQKWAKSIGRDPAKEEKDYDLRGYWKDVVKGNPDLPEGMQNRIRTIKAENAQRGTAHLTDLYKKPNHPTFSDESIYHGDPLSGKEKNQGGHWDLKNKTFTPGLTNLIHWSRKQLQDYFAQNEPDYRVKFAGEK